MYTGKIEPQNVIQLVQNALSDTLELPDINLYINLEEVHQNAKITEFKKKKASKSEELF